MRDERSRLLVWQWSLYEDGHQDRRNLGIHLLTMPFFVTGNVALVLSPWISGRAALGGTLAMGIAMALQGRGHRMEKVPPAPFRGALDVLARIFAEQWITFPRYVLSGKFGRRLVRAPGVEERAS